MEPIIRMSQVRQRLNLNLREMEMLLTVLKTFNTPETNFIKKQVLQTIVSLNLIVGSMERLERENNAFFHAMN